MGPLLIPLTGIIVAYSFMVRSLTTFLPTFLSEEGAGLWFAGASLSLLEIGGVMGALLGGAVSDRLGRRLVLCISMLTPPRVHQLQSRLSCTRGKGVRTMREAT